MTEAQVPCSEEEIRSIILDFAPELSVLNTEWASRTLYVLAVCEERRLVRLLRKTTGSTPEILIYGLTEKGVDFRGTLARKRAR